MLDCYLGRNTQDNVVFTGDGVDDLDRAISFLTSQTLQPGYRLQIDLGAQYSDYRSFDVEDLQAIRAWYVSFYGEASRPVAWKPSRASHLPLQLSLLCSRARITPTASWSGLRGESGRLLGTTCRRMRLGAGSAEEAFGH